MNKFPVCLFLFLFASSFVVNASPDAQEQRGRSKVMLAVMTDLSGRILSNLSGAQGDLNYIQTETINTSGLFQICVKLGAAETAASLLLKYANEAYAGKPDYNFGNDNKEIRSIQDLHKKLYSGRAAPSDGVLQRIQKLVKLACSTEANPITVREMRPPIDELQKEAENFYFFLAGLTKHNNK